MIVTLACWVPPFVAVGVGQGVKFTIVIRYEAGTSGKKRRATDEPTIPSRVRRNSVSRRWCPPWPPPPMGARYPEPVNVA